MIKRKIDKKTATMLLNEFIDTANPNHKSYINDLRNEFEDDYSFVNTLCEQSGNVQVIQDMIIKTHPKSRKNIGALKSGLKFFGMFLIQKGFLDDTFYNGLKIDLDKTWKSVRETVDINDRVFISHRNYLKLLSEIQKYEELNKTFYLALIESVYEGIYSKNMSPIVHLCKEDLNIKANCITVHINNNFDDDNDVTSYILDLGENTTLIGRLLALSEMDEEDYWERTNIYSYFRIKACGLKKSSCFKLEWRKDKERTVEEMCLYFRRKVTDILRIYGYKKMNAQRLFVSGVMHRIQSQICEELSCSMSESLNRSDSPELKRIMTEELRRVNYKISLDSFRNEILSNADIFDE